MTKLIRLFVVLSLVCTALFANLVHAGISGANIRIDLAVTTSPTPAVQPTVVGNFNYSITCTSAGTVLTWPASIFAPLNAATPIAVGATFNSTNSPSLANTCTVAQTSVPAPPTGYAWAAAPASVVLTGVVTGSTPGPFVAAFANVLNPTYTVTSAVNIPAAGSVNCTSPVASGSTSTCTATINAGFSLTGFTTNGCGPASSGNPYTTGAVTANCVVTATFAQIPYIITGVANPAQGGTVTCVSPVFIGAGSNCTATANSGYSFSGFTTSGCGSAGATNPYTTAPISANCTVTAAFTQNPFPVVAVASPVAGGTVVCTQPAVFNATSSCTATANAGYSLTGFSTNGCGTPSVSNPYVTGPIAASCTVTGSFALNSVAITTVAIAAGGGAVTCAPNPVTVGATAMCTAAATPGFVLTSISGCGGTATAQTTYTTGTISAPCTVTAQFAPFVVAPPLLVPTLGGWALLLLALLTVGIGGAAGLRRQ